MLCEILWRAAMTRLLAALSGLAAAATLAAVTPAFAANFVYNGDFAIPNTGGGWGEFNFATTGWNNAAEPNVEIGASGIYGLSCYTAGCQNLEVNENTFG